MVWILQATSLAYSTCLRRKPSIIKQTRSDNKRQVAQQVAADAAAVAVAAAGARYAVHEVLTAIHRPIYSSSKA